MMMMWWQNENRYFQSTKKRQFSLSTHSLLFGLPPRHRCRPPKKMGEKSHQERICDCYKCWNASYLHSTYISESNSFHMKTFRFLFSLWLLLMSYFSLLLRRVSFRWNIVIFLCSLVTSCSFLRFNLLTIPNSFFCSLSSCSLHDLWNIFALLLYFARFLGVHQVHSHRISCTSAVVIIVCCSFFWGWHLSYSVWWHSKCIIPNEFVWIPFAYVFFFFFLFSLVSPPRSMDSHTLKLDHNFLSL